MAPRTRSSRTPRPPAPRPKPSGVAKRTARRARTTRQPSQDPDDAAVLEESPRNSLRLDLPPVTNVYQAFKDLVSKRQSDITAIANSGGLQLKVGTMCSGTEAPIFALKLIKEISQSLTNGQTFMQFNHLFSVENEPFKQAYISRNAPGSTVFRDVMDFTNPAATTAPTILGDHCKIPPDIDLLVAGTSCVDFSTLNSGKINSMRLMSSGTDLVLEWKNSDRDGTNPKSNEPLRDDFFDDFRRWLNSITPAEIQETEKSLGESSFTFLSTLCYINGQRPKMVIMENVSGAPWNFMCDLFLHAAGYAATYTFMDTKDYYIPQTRKRGYVVAVDRRVFGSSADTIIAQWKVQLDELKRTASAPVHDWLLSSHDPLTMRARQDESEKAVASGLSPGKDVQWERSKLRHARVRRLFRLGNGRPLTAWGLGGIDQPYDRIDRLILKGQNDRALDCVDIYYLRCLHAGVETATGTAKPKEPPAGPMQYDIRFKSQVFDLSQNIDRGNINRNFGITGCLTPRGLNLITDQGRLVSGFEALNLQGLPLRDLDLTRESQDELRDLAGNAMTTTVVGTALLSLLISVHRHGSSLGSRVLSKITIHDQAVVLCKPLHQPSFGPPTPEESWSSRPEPFYNVQGVIDMSKRCRRYCYCNGGAKYSAEEIVRCQVCDVFRCKNCAGNPKHRFGSLFSIEDPIMNDSAPQKMMEHFPTALTSVIDKAIDHIPFRPDFQEPAMQSLLLGSLSSVTFYYTRVRVSETVNICYSAKDQNCSFHLQAIISDTCVTWYLFLDPWSPCGKLLSEKLGIPPAHMVRPFGRVRIHPETTGFVPRQDAWEFWVFSEISFDIDIAKPHPSSIEITGIALENLPVATHADLQSITGTYGHHPECDAAEDSLHACIQDRKRYLFKDPTRIGPPQEDCYVISDECRYLDSHEFRDFCVRFSPDWTPQVAGSRARATIKGYWETPVIKTAGIQSNITSSLVSYMKQAGSRYFPGRHDLHKNNNKDHEIITLASVRIDSNMLSDAYLTLLKYERAGPESWCVVSRSDYSALFDLLAPVNVNLDIDKPRIRSTNTKSCEICCPKLPDVHWMEKTTDLAKRSIREPYRLSAEMHEYEQNLRQCGEPLQVVVNIKNSEDMEGWKEVTANYEVNIDLLMHRAVGHLPILQGDSKRVFNVRSFVDIKKGSLYIPNLRFEPFRNSLRHLPEDNSQVSLEGREIFVDGHTLTNKQQISLSWMLERELNPPRFTESEIEECRVDPLNLRVAAVAERDISCAGGVLADDVGFRKTVITLALMAAQQKFDQGESLQQRESSAWNPTALAASLVFVPRHLVNQWREEAAKFLGWKDMDVLTVKTWRDLQGDARMSEARIRTSKLLPRPRTTKTLLEKLRAAKLIIVSTGLFNDEYYTWLGKYAGSLAPPRSIPVTDSIKDTTNTNVLGAFQDWYEDAAVHAREHVLGFNSECFHSAQLEIIKRRQESLQKSWKKVVDNHYDMSTRLGLQTASSNITTSAKGKEVVAATRKEYDDTARADSLTEQDYMAKYPYVLEAFSYARVVYDEFSYENYGVAQFVKHAKAHAKWVLSATPPTGNVKAVCGIGELLGIHVVRPVKLRPGLPLITEGPIVLRENPTEKCLSYGRLSTDKSVQERVKQAHNFLRHFASANSLDEEALGKIKVLENAYCSYMTRRELVKYLDIQRDLRASDMEVSNILKRHNLVEDDITKSSLEKRLRAGLALVYFASVDSTDDDDNDDGTNDKLVSNRRQSLEAAQSKLKYISAVAIWLILRRSEEGAEKKNESATNIVEDLACHFESILEGSAETFGGMEALKAVTDSTFDTKQFEECSRWLGNFVPNQRTSESYFSGFFALLNEQMPRDAWATYFRLPANRIEDLQDLEVSAFIRKHSSLDPSSLTAAQAQGRLRELVVAKEASANAAPRQARNGRRAAKRKADTQLEGQENDEGAEENDSSPVFPRFNNKKKIRGGTYTETESELTDIILKLSQAKDEVIARAKQVTTALNLFRQDSNYKCSACGRHCDDMRFLPECGHFICSSHLDVRSCGQIKSDTYPNGSGCSSLIHRRSIPVDQIDRCPMQAPSMSTVGDKPLPKFSSKTRNILHTINAILENSDEKVLVFYQFKKQGQEICNLLKYYGIAFTPFSPLEAPAATSRNLDQDRAPDRVRILQINSEEAAGSNYQDANHVIFVSTPVFAKQEDFEKYVKQAAGRAIRYGQLRDVNIYYFVTANTFEVDLLQLRKKSYIRIRQEDIARFIPMSDSDGDIGMIDALGISSSEQLTSSLSDEEVWKLTDETNWLVQQNREC